jgi:hypothetical protein
MTHQDEVRVVEIVSVTGGAVGKGGCGGAGADPGTHDGAQGRAALGAEDTAQDLCHRSRRPGQGDAQRVEGGPAHGAPGLGGTVLQAGADGELSQTHAHGHRRLSVTARFSGLSATMSRKYRSQMRCCSLARPASGVRSRTLWTRNCSSAS